MTEVKRLLLELLEEEEHCFVFPSEVAAEFWRRESLRLSERRAIWNDRFLSWDRFKEATFQLSQRAAPVNRVIRMLFAADLLEENRRSAAPIFSALIGPEYADSSPAFLKTLTGILPELQRYREAVELRRQRAGVPGTDAAVDADTRKDLKLLWERYHEFLRANHLFEPSYDKIDVSAMSKHYHIFFPEVIEDWKEAVPFLDSRYIHPVAVGEPPDAPIHRFENSVQELRRLFREISLLLAAGTRASDIAITIPRLELWESNLRRDAELFGVPIDIRQGSPLSEYPEIRLFFRLAECEAGGYSIDALKGLFLSRAFPWRHRRGGESLVRWGIEHHCAGRYGREVLHDPWAEKLGSLGAGEGREAADARSLLAFYREFSRDVQSLVGARSFRSLHTHLQRFIKGRLDTEQWSPESRRIFQFALDALNDLVEAQDRISDLTVADPYSLWLTALGERLYVQRSGAAGIPVYPYRVSAGIDPAHHFIVGATQLGTQVDWRPLSFLREDERSGLGILDINATEEFQRLYLCSGSQVEISFSDQDVAGIELPPGYFVMRGRVERPESLDSERGADAYLAEETIWSGAADLPNRAYAAQKEGVEFFSRVGGGKRSGEMTVAPIASASLRERLIERLSDDAGRLKVSPTRLDRFWECPYGFLLQTGLSVDERSYSIEWADPRTTGSLIHEVLRRVFRRIKEQGGRFDAGGLEDYRKFTDEELGAVFEEWEANGESFVPPVWNSLRDHLRDRIHRLLSDEAERFNNMVVEALEQEYFVEGPTVRLEGRIDRISSDADGVLLVDYKRSDRVKRKDVRPKESTDAPLRPATFQIPFYVKLIESRGMRVKTAAYYAVEKSKYNLVFDEGERKAWMGRDELDQLLAATEEAVREMELRVRGGGWMVPDPRAGCEACRFRSVCRMKYSVR